MTREELKNICGLHVKWMNDEPDGKRANLCNADLRGAYLCDANLCGAYLCGADLRGAYLYGADLYCANLYGANLCNADLRGAYLCGAYLCGANLCDANLYGANLYGANLRGANLYGVNLRDAINIPFIPMSCPESGSYIGFKKVSGLIVVLRILEDALRSSATGRKCRASKAEVLKIENLDGSPSDVDEVRSSYDHSFIYRPGEIVSVDNFDTNRWNECAPGIHHFINRQEAVDYNN